MTRKIRIGGFTALAALVAVQFVQPERGNPPVDPASNPPAHLAGVFRRACADCHSNETVWPWYSRFAPVSWVVAGHVREGREHLNFSEWNRLSPEKAGRRLAEACDEAKAGKMPLWQYTLLHPQAKMSAKDISVLCAAP